MKEQINEQLQDLITREPSEVVFLCGAGISLDAPTLLPTVNKFIYEVLEGCGAKQEIIDKVFLKSKETSYRFESLVDEIRKKCDEDLSLANLFNSATYNKTHFMLATMLQRGASIITTNFDNCIENACSQNNMEVNERRVVYKGEDLNNCERILQGALIKIHGSHPLEGESDSELVITIKALAKTERAFALLPNWRQYLLDLIKDKIVVVMGYSCSDDFDLVPLLEQSKPSKIVWLNFVQENKFPTSNCTISNEKIKKISKHLSLLYFDGQIVPFLQKWGEEIGIKLHGGKATQQFSVQNYIASQFQTMERKNVLCNEIFLSYGLYKEIIVSKTNPSMKLQEIKAQFRLGYYRNTISLCQKLLEMTNRTDIVFETQYYLSSAYYYQKEYEKALEVIEECVKNSWEEGNMISYTNALINYASILYVYATTLPKEEQSVRLDEAEKSYYLVLKYAKGKNIEAGANALWGLGDLENYRGNPHQALEWMSHALEILQKIGNAYAIELLENAMSNITEGI